MVGEFGEVGVAVCPVDSLQRLAHLSMQPQTAGRREFLVQRLADQGMAEGVASEAARQCGDDPSRFGLLKGRQQCLAVELTRSLEARLNSRPMMPRSSGPGGNDRKTRDRRRSLADALRIAGCHRVDVRWPEAIWRAASHHR
jgi:hypothetical protein